MKNMIKNIKFDIRKIWVYIFLLFMLILPFNFISKYLLISILLFGVIIYFSRKINISKFPFFLFLFSFLIRLAVVFIIKTPPESDFLVLYNASKNVLSNNYSFLNDTYFSLWTYQVGFVYVQSLFLMICDSLVFLKVINCVISSALTVLIYLISLEFVNNESSKASSILYVILPFAFSYVTVLTNQHLSSLLIYFAIYIIISKRFKISETRKYILAAVLMVIANVIRPESIIPIFSIILFLLLTISKKNVRENIKNILALVGTYFCLTIFISSIFSVTNLAPGGLKNNDPYWKFVLGFNHETGGKYSSDDYAVINNHEASKQLIKERIFTSPVRLIKLFNNKVKTFWLYDTLSWSFNFIYDKCIILGDYVIYISTLVNILESINNNMMYIVYILLIIGVYRYIQKKNYNKYILILINQMFVTFGVYLLIEVQPRYSYHIQITAFILASLGIEVITNYLSKNKKKKRNILEVNND